MTWTRRRAASPRARPRSGRGSKGRADVTKAYWKLGVAGGVVLAVLVIALIVKPTEVNALTGCPKSQTAPEAHTIILIDETDRLPPNELRFVKDLVITEYMWLPTYGRLTVRSLHSDPAEGEEIVICRVAESSTTAGLLDNERTIKKRFDAIAGERLSDLFRDLETAPQQEASPIMEAVGMIFERTDFLPNVEARRLVVVSDLAQHSEAFTMYGRGQSLKPPEDLAEEFFQNMSGVDVRLQYVRRPGLRGLQGRDHRDFWESYIGSQEPNSVAIGHGPLLGEASDRKTYLYSPPGGDAPARR